MLTRPGGNASCHRQMLHAATSLPRVNGESPTALNLSQSIRGVTYAIPNVTEGDTVQLPDGRGVSVLDVYDDEHWQEGGVRAILVVDDS